MPTITALKPPKLRPRQDIDDLAIRKEIFKHGLSVKWELAQRCPCKQIHTATANSAVYGTDVVSGEVRERRSNCPNCKGRGWAYHSTQTIQAVVLDAEADVKIPLLGAQVTGSVKITTLHEHVPAAMDRMTVLDSVIVYSEVRKRTSSAVEALRYPIVTRSLVLGTIADPTIPTPTTLDVLNLWKTGTDGVFVDALTQDVDFEVSSGQINWALGDALNTAPVEEAWYSVSYYINPVYVINNFPKVSRVSIVAKDDLGPVTTPLPVLSTGLLEFLGDDGT